MKTPLKSVKLAFQRASKTVLFVLVSIIVLSSTITSCKSKYTGPKYEADLYQMIDDYATAYCKQNNMELIHVGDFTDPSKHLMFGMWLRSYSSEDLKQGRNRAIALVNNFLHTLKQNDTAKTYFSEAKRYFPLNKSDTINIKQIGVKIAYWNKDVNRPLKPYLAEIDFYDEKFHYYEADPETQSLRLVFEESYEDAVASLKKV